jgi:small subunit ribosomal protein S20
LANIKSAIKRNRQNEKRRLRNRIFRGRARTFVKRARQEMAGGDITASLAATKEAISALDKAAQKGVLHPNNAARRKSRLMRHMNELKKQSAA